MWPAQFHALPCTLREGLVAAGFNHIEDCSAAISPGEPNEAYQLLAEQVGYAEADGEELLRDLVSACSQKTGRTPARSAAVTDAEVVVSEIGISSNKYSIRRMSIYYNKYRA